MENCQSLKRPTSNMAPFFAIKNQIMAIATSLSSLPIDFGLARAQLLMTCANQARKKP